LPGSLAENIFLERGTDNVFLFLAKGKPKSSLALRYENHSNLASIRLENIHRRYRFKTAIQQSLPLVRISDILPAGSGYDSRHQ
jgi:hypothetical protein